jgi:hypothetical protein
MLSSEEVCWKPAIFDQSKPTLRDGQRTTVKV